MVAPFITLDAFRQLEEVISPRVEVQVFTRWNPEEVARKVSDPHVLDIIEKRGRAKMFLHPELHAKAYVIDSSQVFVGSANLTRKALGYIQNPNWEVLSRHTPVPAYFFSWLWKLRAASTSATQALKEKVLQEAEAFFSESGTSPAPYFIADEYASKVEETEVSPVQLFPHFRSPDRIFGLFQAINDENWESEKVQQILVDLSFLNVMPLNQNRDDFHQAVRRSLLELPLVRALNDQLKPSQRFGFIAKWLQETYPDHFLTIARAKLQAQVIYRWLSYFVPDKYEVREANYSEILIFKQL